MAHYAVKAFGGPKWSVKEQGTISMRSIRIGTELIMGNKNNRSLNKPNNKAQ